MSQLEQTKLNHTPDGKDGQQFANSIHEKWDGGTGKNEILEKLNGGDLPKKHGTGYEDHLYSLGSKASIPLFFHPEPNDL